MTENDVNLFFTVSFLLIPKSISTHSHQPEPFRSEFPSSLCHSNPTHHERSDGPSSVGSSARYPSCYKERFSSHPFKRNNKNQKYLFRIVNLLNHTENPIRIQPSKALYRQQNKRWYTLTPSTNISTPCLTLQYKI